MFHSSLGALGVIANLKTRGISLHTALTGQAANGPRASRWVQPWRHGDVLKSKQPAGEVGHLKRLEFIYSAKLEALLAEEAGGQSKQRLSGT